MAISKVLWAYRGFIIESVKREFQSRYRNSLLGALWAVLNPLAMIVVYTLIFAQVMRTRLLGADSTFAYSIYLCAGILTWGLFAEITGRAQNMFLEHANLIKKLNFPRLCLPVALVLSAVINFSIIFSLFTAFLIVSGNFPGWPFVALFPVLAVQIALAIGLGVSLGVLNVFFRDVGHFYGIFLQFWFWLTPIVYPLTILPDRLQPMMAFNPMASLLQAYQTIFVSAQWPNWATLWPVAVLALLLCSLGIHLFRQHVGEMVDEL